MHFKESKITSYLIERASVLRKMHQCERYFTVLWTNNLQFRIPRFRQKVYLAVKVSLDHEGEVPETWNTSFKCSSIFKNIWANPGLFLFIFVFFHITQFNKLMKACSGLEPGAVEWKVQTKCHPKCYSCVCRHGSVNLSVSYIPPLLCRWVRIPSIH